jgi:hypothetical protein
MEQTVLAGAHAARQMDQSANLLHEERTTRPVGRTQCNLRGRRPGHVRASSFETAARLRMRPTDERARAQGLASKAPSKCVLLDACGAARSLCLAVRVAFVRETADASSSSVHEKG